MADIGGRGRGLAAGLLLLLPATVAAQRTLVLEQFDAEMHVADISKEAEEAIDEVAGDEAIAQAVEAEFGVE